MLVDAWCTLTLRRIRRPNGRRGKFWKPSRFDLAAKFLLRDRDRIYGHAFREQVAVMQIKEVLGAPRSPWQRAYVERVIGSIRRECLDHVIVLDEEGLRRVLAAYIRYYHKSRLHLSLEKDSPDPRSARAGSGSNVSIGCSKAPM